jgi:hypothetical protein
MLRGFGACLIIFSFVFLASCKKDPAIIDPDGFSVTASDTIEYHDIADTTFSLYDSCLLDVDSQAGPDFKLYSTQYPGTLGAYSTFLGITSNNTNDGFVSLPTSASPGGQGMAVLSSGNLIEAGLRYINPSNIRIYYYTPPSWSISWGTDNTDKYIGFKIARSGKNYFGWILFSNYSFGMTVKSWAINRTANNTIDTGQTS